MAWEIPAEQMEVFSAAAELAGFEGDLERILEHGIDKSDEQRARKAQRIVEFRNGIICEGIIAVDSVSVREVARGMFELDFNRPFIDAVLEDYEKMVSKDIQRMDPLHPEFDQFLTPRLLTIDHIVDPASHRIIHLGQFASEASHLRGEDSRIRLKEILKRHPYYDMPRPY